MTGRRARHRVLVAEDDPKDRADLCAILESRGYSVLAVATVEEALAAMDAEDFCLYVFDQQMPFEAGKEPALGGGELLITTARTNDPRRTAAGFHVTPILVVTGYSGFEDFVSKMYELGASQFMSKPVKANEEKLLDKVRVLFERAGRGEHGGCAAFAAPAKTDDAPTAAATAAATAAVRLAIDGTTTKAGRTAVRVNDERRDLQDSKLVPLLRFVVAHLRSPGSWSGRDALGLSRDATTHIRKAFEGLVPAGFDVIEGDRRGQFRLNPAIVVEHVGWDALVAHPDPQVHKIAVEWRKRRSGD